ncbi:MAG: hypothetical protein RBR15_12940 [Sphaerochaeta sp.]|nr:hypothetical protein [Sphaerochaeta sp.]
MYKKFFSLLGLFVLISGSAFASIPESWVNNSIMYGRSYNSELALSSGSTDTIGYDFSWFGFPDGSQVGIATHLGLGFSFDAAPSFTSLHAFMGPAFNTVLAGGVIGYAAIGPSYTFSGSDQMSSFSEQQLGVGFDVGARFRLAESERWDLGIIAGTLGDVTLLHLVNSTRQPGFSANLSAYIGFSFGSALTFPFYGLFAPSVYYRH